LPIAREEGWLTLLVDSPLKSGLADELARRTGLSVKLALCSSRVVRETVRQVYRLDPVQQKVASVLSLEAFWSLATSPPVKRWGLTVRRNQVIGWIENGDSIQRHALMHNWLAFLDRLLSPPASQVLPPHGMRQWRASVRSDQSPAAVLVNSLSGPGGHDLVFEPVSERSKDNSRLPSTAQLLQLRQAAGDRPTVIAVHSPSGQAARELVTRLPQLLLKPDHRSVCLLREGVHAISEDILVVAPAEEGEEEILGFLEGLKLDAVALEIAPTSQELWDRALHLAPLVLIVLTGLKDDEQLPPGINWLLSKSAEDQADWDLV
jgi:type IV pilus assembly protein PilB